MAVFLKRCRTWCGAYLVVALLLSAASTQEEYMFLSEPPDSSYYSYPGRVALFPCEAVRTDDSDNQQVINPVLFRNSLSMNIYFPPPRHRAWANHEGNVVGIEVNPTTMVDSGSTYQCVITENNRTSRRTTLYVGDGRPFPVTVDMVDQRLFSLSLDWSPAPAPVDAPVQGYTVFVTEPDGRRFEVLLEGNDTEADLLHLVPGTRYSIAVLARNAHGEGRRSEELIAFTVRPEVTISLSSNTHTPSLSPDTHTPSLSPNTFTPSPAPYPPTNVSATESTGNSSSSITVNWTLSQIDPEVMTPVERYAVFYGQGPRSGLQNITTADNTTTRLTITNILEGGTYTVGVAAMNSGGVSMVTYHSQEIVLPNFATTGIQLGMTTIISIAVAGAVLFSLVIFILIIVAICYIRARTRRISSMNLGGGSPSTKKKSTALHRTCTNGESSSLSSSLHVAYVREPRAIGSPPPSSLETSSSNFNVSYTQEPRAAGSPSPPPVTSDPATSITFGKR